MNGEEHKLQRRQVSGPFEKRAIGVHHETIAASTTQMLDGWRPGETRDIATEMTVLARKITSTMLFGMDQMQIALEIGEMLDPWVELNHQLGLAALLPTDDFMPRYDELLALAERLNQIAPAKTKILPTRMIRQACARTMDIYTFIFSGRDFRKVFIKCFFACACIFCTTIVY